MTNSSPTRGSAASSCSWRTGRVPYSDDGQILRAMQRARENGAIIMMHAENGIAIDVLVQQALSGARPTRSITATRPAALRRRRPAGPSRSPRWRRLSLLLCICRRAEALAAVAQARDNGATSLPRPAAVSYLTLEDQLARPASRRQMGCSTPLRSKHESHQRDLWRGLRSNDLAIVSTTTARSASRTRRSWARDFSRSRTGSAGSSTGGPGVSGRGDGQLSVSAGSRPSPRPPACSGSTPAGRHRARFGCRHRGLRPGREPGSAWRHTT